MRESHRSDAWYAENIVARPEKHIPASLEESVETGAPADVFAGAGPWQGETTEELLRVLREARQHDDVYNVRARSPRGGL
jgi:hypothetical protein